MKINYQKIYEKLGYLFYAVATADQRVHPAEIEKLRTLIAREWLPMENSIDSYGTDAAHYITISFEYLLNESIPRMKHTASFQTIIRSIRLLFQRISRKKFLLPLLPSPRPSLIAIKMKKNTSVNFIV